MIDLWHSLVRSWSAMLYSICLVQRNFDFNYFFFFFFFFLGGGRYPIWFQREEYIRMRSMKSSIGLVVLKMIESIFRKLHRFKGFLFWFVFSLFLFCFVFFVVLFLFCLFFFFKVNSFVVLKMV